MRRIISACLLQTMRFDTTKEADGSLVVKIRKQYNSYSTDGYLQ